MDVLCCKNVSKFMASMHAAAVPCIPSALLRRAHAHQSARPSCPSNTPAVLLRQHSVKRLPLRHGGSVRPLGVSDCFCSYLQLVCNLGH